MSDFPFAIDVQVYPSDDTTFNVGRAEWLPRPNIKGDGICVVYSGPRPGLNVVDYKGLASTVVPYSYIEDCVTRGGKIKVYYNLTANVTPAAGALVFLMGALVSDVSELTPGYIWATVEYPADSTSPALPVGYTVATLPAATADLKGTRAYVNDATAPTFLGVLTGGGAVVCPVFCNGTEWVAG